MTPERKLNAPMIPWQIDRKIGATEPSPMLRGSDWAREPQESLRLRGGTTNLLEWYIECEVNGLRILEQSVDVDPDIRGGLPVLKGTGFTVAQTLAEIAEGPAADDLARRFNLVANDIREMLNGLSLVLQRPFSR